MYQALYRKWRPSVFDDVVGQTHITSILKSEVAHGKISHAYLFCGPRGTGKTTCAKIIAKAANCEHPENGNPCGKCAACQAVDAGTTTDILEMDAASNNGVDNIRELRDGIIYTPADLRYRVYIIDEVHMLSIPAFNALLKTLEEPPEHAIFILATTELHKIPATVLSRCQRFDFHRVPSDAIVSRLATVCAGENFSADNSALELIARLSQGGMRDALNMLEYCAGEPGTITAERAERLLGAASRTQLAALAEAIAARDVSSALAVLDEVYLSSKDIAVFWRELIGFTRDMLVAVATRMANPSDEILRRSAERFALPTLFSVLRQMIDAEADMQKNPAAARLYAEMALIRVCDGTQPTEREAQASAAVSPSKPAAPSEIPTAAPAPQKAPQSASSVVREAPSGTRRSVRKWQEIVRRLSAGEGLLVPFLQAATAFEETDGTFCICFESSFGMTLLNDTRKAAVAAAVNAVLESAYTPAQIVGVLREEVGGIRAPIEDLLDAENTESVDEK